MTRPRPAPASADLRQYASCARASCARVIREYSTSFSLASRLFAPATAAHVRHVYGLVRIADEIVDGAGAQAGLSRDEQRVRLDELEAETERAIASGYSTNLIVHAFAETARSTGVGPRLTAPFFASMRRDLSDEPFDTATVAEYIHGSAEVVGLMCLQCFVAHTSVDAATRERLQDGARHLGAAFQKVNFLRDVATDWYELGRNYFPGVSPATFGDGDKHALLDDIDADLEVASRAIGDLPGNSRAAVGAAYELFRALAAQLRSTPAASLLRTRVSVPLSRKLAIVLRARLGRVPRAAPRREPA